MAEGKLESNIVYKKSIFNKGKIEGKKEFLGLSDWAGGGEIRHYRVNNTLYCDGTQCSGELSNRKGICRAY